MASSSTPSGHAAPNTPRTAMRLMNSCPPAMIDPVLRNQQAGQVRPREEDDSSPSTPSSPSPAPPNPLPPLQPSLEAFARGLTLRKRRKTEHANEVLQVAKMSAQERAVYMFDKLLEIDNRTRKEEADAEAAFELPPAVKTNTSKYVLALLFCGHVPRYMLNMDDVLKVLADNNVYSRTWTPNRVDKLRRYIQTFATNKRCVIKDRIEESIEALECLDSLCQGLVGKSGIKVTPGFRARAAFLRFNFANYPDHQGNDFWEFADSELKTLRANANGNADSMQYFMNNFARQDATAYTVGVDKAYTVVTDDSELPNFQRAVSNAAAGIVPLVPSVPPVPAPAVPSTSTAA